jgi:hypothetical protein
MNNQEMTVKDILQDVIKKLNDIKVPMSMIESIGIPVAQCISGIKLCVDAIEKNEVEEQKAAEEPKLELVADDESAEDTGVIELN